MRILYLAHRIPYPPNKGDKIRSFNEIKYLSKQHEIHLACLADDPKDLKYTEDLAKYCKTVTVVPMNPKLARLKSMFSLLSNMPLSVPYFYSSKLQRTIDHLLSTNDYDVIFCFSSPMAEYVFKSKFLVSSRWKLDTNHPQESRIQQPATTNEHPATSTKQLATRNPQPETRNPQPATRNQQPVSSNQKPGTRLIMDFVDVDSDKWGQYAKYTRFPMSWIYRLESRRLAVYERKVAEAFDHSIFVTQAEVEVFRSKNPHIHNVTAITNGVDLDYFSPNYGPSLVSGNQNPATGIQQLVTRNPELGTHNPQLATRNSQPPSTLHPPPPNHVLLFTGAMDYYANIDGVVWFAKEIFPLIKGEIPEIEFYIVGSNPTEEVKALSNNDGIKVTGYVSDTREYLKKGTVAVVPLRIARGIQNKVLEAMAMGLPVVTTSQALEGICAEAQRDVVVEDEPGAFSRAVLKVLTTPSLQVELGTHARKCIERNYSWGKNLSKLDELCNLAV